MIVEYLGHSCFKLTESTGTSIITDPYSNIGYDMPKVESDIVTCSHDHYDHNNIKNIGGNPIVLKTLGTYEHNGVTITNVKTFHDEKKGKHRGANLAFKFRMDGIDICHLGDIGHECNPELVDYLLPINVLLIPVGGNCTIDADTAYEYVEKLMPDIVIPMHYKTKSVNIDIDKVGPFLDKFDEENIDEHEDSIIEIDREDLDSTATRVVVLKRKKD